MSKYKNDCYKQGKSVLQIALTIKCSMQCVDCMQGCHPQLRANSSLPTIYDYNIFKEDLQYLRQKKIKLDVIDVFGGEIFELHNVFDYLTVIRDCYPNSKIAVITNGVFLNEYKIEKLSHIIDVLVITNYPGLSNKYAKLFEYCKKYDLCCTFHCDDHSKYYRDEFLKPLLYRKPKFDSTSAYNNCGCNIPILYASKLRLCCVCLSLSARNNLFNTQYPLSELDIHKILTVDDLKYLERLIRPDICSYCAIFEEAENVKWKRGNKIEFTDYVQ